MVQEMPVTEVQVRPFPETVVGTIGVLLSWFTIHARMSRFAPGAIEFVVADVIFEPAAPPAVSSVALMAAKAADGANNDKTARLAARIVALIFRAPQAGNSSKNSDLTAAGSDAPLPRADPAHRLMIPRPRTRGSGHPASPGRAPDRRVASMCPDWSRPVET